MQAIKDTVCDQRDIAKKQLGTQQDAVQHEISKRQNECLQLFRLTKSDKDATYEWYKERVDERVDGTCTWVLEHKYFRTWLEQDAGPLLISADPGCGRSVLAKYLIDHVLPPTSVTCYFFFKEQDQNTVRQSLCAILHQLCSKKPSLIQHAMPYFEKNGAGLINSTSSLWAIFQSAVQDPQAGPIIIVLDALDECAGSELEDLVRKIESQFHHKQSDYGKLRYLLTNRPYEQVVSEFETLSRAFPQIRIPGEDDSEKISEEVNHVIKYRVEKLAIVKKLSDNIKVHLVDQLLGMKHRTYLWVYLIFDHLRKEDFKKTQNGISSAIESLPKSITQAYEQILSKSGHPDMVRKALTIILAAKRPLTLAEMNVAVNITESTESFSDIDPEGEEDFKIRLRSWCGLFISIYGGKIYFLHQTAREFLLNDLSACRTELVGLQWNHSIDVCQAHAELAGLYVRFLCLFRAKNSFSEDLARNTTDQIESQALLDYSVSFWSCHFREAPIIGGTRRSWYRQR